MSQLAGSPVRMPSSVAVWLGRPVPLALCLAILTWPIVAWSYADPLLFYLGFQDGRTYLEPLDVATALATTLPTVLTAAALGAAVGARVRRTRRSLGVLLTVCVSWLIGVATLGAWAALLHAPLVTGVYCLDSCSAAITADSGHFSPIRALTTGAFGYGESIVLAPLVLFLGSPGMALVGLAAAVVARVGSGSTRIFGLVAIHATINWASIAYGGVAAYACLAAGVMAWDWWLDRSGQAPEKRQVDDRTDARTQRLQPAGE